MNLKPLAFIILNLFVVLGAAAVLGAGAAHVIATPNHHIDSQSRGGISLGQPGTVFRYLQTFGETGVPYFADADHIYQPEGVGLDGAGNVWVAETTGGRVLHYTGDGTFLLSIGTVGMPFLADETHFGGATDSAIDGNGNIWIADYNAARVVKFDPAGSYLMQLGTTWEGGSDNSHFSGPVGVAFDSAGNIYVSDMGNHRIQVFNSSGVYSTTIGVTGEPGADNAHFDSPARIAVDDSDNLYVADQFNHRVQIFDSNHNYVVTLGTSGEPGGDNDHFNSPHGVAIDASFIYVADSENHRIQRFDRATYSYEDTLGSGGSGDYEFISPRDVAVDPAGNLYVADALNHRVQKFNSSLAYVHTFGSTGVPYLTDGYHYNQPNKVAVDANGNIGILEDEGRGHRFIKLNASGVPQFTIGEAGVVGDDNEHFTDARGVAFDADGNIYIGDCGNHRVQIYSSDGVYLATLGSGWGQGNDQFFCPTGLTFDGSSNLYVADALNHRVQVFDSNHNYVATLGVTGEAGSDNGHFNGPHDVAVDGKGNIYVADAFNFRVQVFDSSHNYVATLGATGEGGSDNGHFGQPYDVALDGKGNIYVADDSNSRVQVFDANLAYLTTIGGAWGSLASQFRVTLGVEVDTAGNVYITDLLNHRIQKFGPGVPEWQQVNINGFGERQATGMTALEAFNGQLYAGASNWEAGGQIYRASDGVTWSAVTQPGFGSYTNTVPAILDLGIFDGQLYASTGWGSALGQVWRSPDGTTWEAVTNDGFGDEGNTAVSTFIAFNGMIYAGTANNGSGAQVWRSSSGDIDDWARVAPDDPDTPIPSGVTGFAVFDGALYAAVEGDSPAQVWRSVNGSVWDTVVADGFGDVNNRGTGGFAEFGGYLYLGTWNDMSGAQLWRSADGTTWEQMVSDGFGNIANFKVEMLVVYDGQLYAEVNNAETGLKIWRLSDGTIWEQVNPDGFGDSNNVAVLWNSSTAVFQGRLHVGTWNSANGGEIWRYDRQEWSIYMPLIVR